MVEVVVAGHLRGQLPPKPLHDDGPSRRHLGRRADLDPGDRQVGSPEADPDQRRWIRRNAK